MTADNEHESRSRNRDGSFDSIDAELSQLVHTESHAHEAIEAWRYRAEGWRLDHGRWICTQHNQTFCKICAAIEPPDHAPASASRHDVDVSTDSEQVTNDLPRQLERLGRMYERGLLNDEEFATAKRKVLGNLGK